MVSHLRAPEVRSCDLNFVVSSSSRALARSTFDLFASVTREYENTRRDASFMMPRILPL